MCQLADQLDWHWDHHLRPKLAGLTDEEYLWEPVPGCWNVRPRPDGDIQARGRARLRWISPGRSRCPRRRPRRSPGLWRLAHIIVGVFGMRAANHFGAEPVSYENFPYACTARQALQQLDSTYGSWGHGDRGLCPADLARPCGPAEGPFAEYPLAALVLHINREALHHGAEVLLLRDLYRNQATLGA